MSSRLDPNLLADSNSASVLLFDPSDRREIKTESKDKERVQVKNFEKACIFYSDNETNIRRFEVVENPVEYKGSLACKKTVYGAAFSGYPEYRNSGEEATINELVKQALSFFERPYQSKDTTTQRRALHDAASHVLQNLRLILENEVDKYLQRMVKVLLDPSFKVPWHPLRNNCQRLVDRLLQGKDFEYFFPRLPKHAGAASDPTCEVQWPRYLMSFNDRIEGDSISLHQPNSLLTKFFSRTRFCGDVVDFIRNQFQGRVTAQNYAALLLQEGALRTPEECVEMSNALWEMPRDTLSILQFHHCRSRSRYTTSAGSILTQRQWMENRLLLFLLSDIVASMSGALGTRLLELFRTNPQLVSKVILPKARVMGTARAGERVRILQMPAKQIVYFIASEVDTALDELFDAPEEEVDLIVGALRNAFRQWDGFNKNSIINTTMSVLSKPFSKLKGRKRQAKRGFKSVLRRSMNINPFSVDFVLSAIEQAIRLYEIRKRDGWFHLDFGGLTMVLQLLRKSKTIRK